MAAVVVNNLKKVYGKEALLAVDNVSFEVHSGEIFGLIGPDGAGKSSIFRMLTTLLLPDGGSATVNGYNVSTDYKAIRKSIGYMPGRFSLYQDLSVEENLNFFATVFGTSVAENYHLIRDIYIQLEPFKNRKAGKLSGGMKQKLALCCALIHKPSVLFLDEPTTGVDPVSRKEFWEMLQRLKAQGIAILVSTPYMDEAAQCDRIALIQQGKILSVSSPLELQQSFPHRLYAVQGARMYQLLQAIESSGLAEACYAFGDTAHVIPAQALGNTEQLKQTLQTAGIDRASVSIVAPGIEDCFIHLLRSHVQ